MWGKTNQKRNIKKRAKCSFGVLGWVTACKTSILLVIIPAGFWLVRMCQVYILIRYRFYSDISFVGTRTMDLKTRTIVGYDVFCKETSLQHSWKEGVSSFSALLLCNEAVERRLRFFVWIRFYYLYYYYRLKRSNKTRGNDRNGELFLFEDVPQTLKWNATANG